MSLVFWETQTSSNGICLLCPPTSHPEVMKCLSGPQSLSALVLGMSTLKLVHSSWDRLSWLRKKITRICMSSHLCYANKASCGLLPSRPTKFPWLEQVIFEPLIVLYEPENVPVWTQIHSPGGQADGSKRHKIHPNPIFKKCIWQNRSNLLLLINSYCSDPW